MTLCGRGGSRRRRLGQEKGTSLILAGWARSVVTSEGDITEYWVFCVASRGREHQVPEFRGQEFRGVRGVPGTHYLIHVFFVLGFRGFGFGPGFCGFKTRPTILSKRSKNVGLPSGRPVRPCSRKSRSCSSGSALCKKPFQSLTIANRYQFRPKGIQLHVSRRRQQVRLVHDERSEAALPQVATPFLAEVYAPRVAAMGFADGPPQAAFSLWHCD